MAGAQIRRFLVLHKELDADDGELTRTMKIRRGLIAERYGTLVKALYDGSKVADVATEVTFEDGRKGTLAARVAIRDMKTHPVAAEADGEGRVRAPTGNEIAAGEAILSVENVSLAFGGVKAITDVSFDIRKGEIRAIIGPNGAGKTSMLNVINGFYTPQHGRITFKGATRSKMRPHEAASRRHRAHVPERRAVPRHDGARQHHRRALAADAPQLLLAAAAPRPRDGRGGRAPPARRGHHRVPRDRAYPQGAGRRAALRAAEAGRARPRARDGAGPAAARRADGRHEPRREGGHVALHPRREQLLRHHDRADRARHGRGDGPLRPRGRARLRPQDRRRHAGRGEARPGA